MARTQTDHRRDAYVVFARSLEDIIADLQDASQTTAEIATLYEESDLDDRTTSERVWHNRRKAVSNQLAVAASTIEKILTDVEQMAHDTDEDQRPGL